MDKQLILFEIPAPHAAQVWSTLSDEERALVASVLVRLMARAVAHLADGHAHPESGHD